MSANNTINLIGNLGEDPDLRTTSTGTQIANFSLGVTRTRKDQNGNKVTDWFQIKLFGKQAELAQKYLRKGSKVAVVGTCEIEEWEKDGQKHSRTTVAADGFQMLDPANGQQQGGYQQAAPQQQYAPAPAAPPVAAPAGPPGWQDDSSIPSW